MIKAALLSVALVFAAGSVVSARTATDFSAAQRTSSKHYKSSSKHARHTRGGGERLQGEAACSADAKRLCRKEIPGGDMAVLGCFKLQAARLSGGCRTLLQSYGQI